MVKDNSGSRSRRGVRPGRAIVAFLRFAVALIAGTSPALADGSEIVPLPVNTGCYGIATYGVALLDDGAGSVTVTPPGPILGVFLEWVGSEDETPPTPETSTLTINGVAVDGTRANDPAGSSTVFFEWYSWWANIGPAGGPFAGLGLVDDLNPTVDISGWDGTGQRNGATVTVIYDTTPCAVPRTIGLQRGVDWYWSGTFNHEHSELLVFAFPPAATDRTATIHVAHAGTDANQYDCRGSALWMVAGTGAAPASEDFDLSARGTGGRDYGINGGVEVVNDPFTGPMLPCVPTLNPPPDEPYEAGHPCPGGAAACPYRALAFQPLAGGDVGPEWGVLAVDVLIPAGSAWIALQGESEHDQQGESGSIAGVSIAIDAEPTTSCAPSLTCADRDVCNDPGQCAASVACVPGVAVACHEGGAPVSASCAPSSPYAVGTTAVEVDATIGSERVAASCAVVVRDCEPPTCTAPAALELECTSPCGVDPADPRVASWLAAASASDNCAGATLSHTLPAALGAGCGPGGATEVVFHVADAAGYAATCSGVITVVDTTPPTVTCPAPIELECQGPGGIPISDPRVQVFLAAASASDACGATALAHDAPALLPSACGPGATTIIRFTGGDGCGLESTCETSITVVDRTAPSAVCPAPTTIECSAKGGVPATDPRVAAFLGSGSAGDTCGAAAITAVAPPFLPAGCSPGRATPIDFTATDACSLTDTCRSALTVVDAMPPTIVCPAPITVDCGGLGGVPATDPVIAAFLAGGTGTDVCSDLAVEAFAPSFFPGGCGPGATTSVTFLARDACGLTATCVSTVTVRDVAAPAITCPAPITLECQSRLGVLATDPAVALFLTGATATDSCGSATITTTAPAAFPSACGPGLTTPVIFTASDGCGNVVDCVSTVTVVDTTPPDLSVPDALILECTGPGGVDPGEPTVLAWLDSAAASDVCGDAAVTHDAPLLFPAGCALGTRTPVKFDARDSCGHASEETSSVVVIDTVGPVVADCGFGLVPTATDPLPPRLPKPPSSPTSGSSDCTSRARVRIDCGIATDLCASDPIARHVELVAHNTIVTDSGCVELSECVAVECDEVVEVELLGPACGREPKCPSGPVRVSSDGIKILSAERLELKVTARDACGNDAAACVVGLPDAKLPILCPPEQRCPKPACAPTPLGVGGGAL